MKDQAKDFLKRIKSADDWESRLRIILQLANNLEPYPEKMKQPEYEIKDCLTKVYFCSLIDPRTSAHHFYVDTDVRILKGLVAVLLLFCQDMEPKDLGALDLRMKLEKLGLTARLTGTRRMAIDTIIERINLVNETSQKR